MYRVTYRGLIAYTRHAAVAEDMRQEGAVVEHLAWWRAPLGMSAWESGMWSIFLCNVALFVTYALTGTPATGKANVVANVLLTMYGLGVVGHVVTNRRARHARGGTTQ